MGKFSGRNIISKPACPFCGMLIEKPKELATRIPSEMPLGICSCGAVYAYDVTGHNLGTAMIEALVFGCDGDWDLAWGLLPEEDYLEKKVNNYDIETHSIVDGGAYEGRRIAGTLYFIRLQKDIREVTEEGSKRRLEQATSVSTESSGKGPRTKSFTKKEVEDLVEGYDLEGLRIIAQSDKRVIRDLQRLIYSADKLLRFKATDAMGKIAATVAQYNPTAISKLLQRLFSAVSDTAASSWGCLDAIGEIISNSPEQFAGYGPQLYQYASERELLAEVLRALGKIAAVRPALFRKTRFRIIPFLRDPDSNIRAYAIILLGNLGAHEARDDLTGLQDDSTEIQIYQNGVFKKKTVGELASDALEKL